MLEQDAHEFLNYLLNECSELLEKEAKSKAGSKANGTPTGDAPPGPTWIHELFQVRCSAQH